MNPDRCPGGQLINLLLSVRCAILPFSSSKTNDSNLLRSEKSWLTRDPDATWTHGRRNLCLLSVCVLRGSDPGQCVMSSLTQCSPASTYRQWQVIHRESAPRKSFPVTPPTLEYSQSVSNQFTSRAKASFKAEAPSLEQRPINCT